MFNWLGVVTLAVLYNLWTCILRQAFREVQQSCSACWITIDVVCDLVYLLDILVQFRTGYLNQVSIIPFAIASGGMSDECFHFFVVTVVTLLFPLFYSDTQAVPTPLRPGNQGK